MPLIETCNMKQIAEAASRSIPTLRNRVREGILKPLPGKKKGKLRFEVSVVNKLIREGKL